MFRIQPRSLDLLCFPEMAFTGMLVTVMFTEKSPPLNIHKDTFSIMRLKFLPILNDPELDLHPTSAPRWLEH